MDKMIAQMSKSKACEGASRWEYHLAKAKVCCLFDPSESNAAGLMHNMLCVSTQCSNWHPLIICVAVLG